MAMPNKRILYNVLNGCARQKSRAAIETGRASDDAIHAK